MIYKYAPKMPTTPIHIAIAYALDGEGKDITNIILAYNSKIGIKRLTLQRLVMYTVEFAKLYPEENFTAVFESSEYSHGYYISKNEMVFLDFWKTKQPIT